MPATSLIQVLLVALAAHGLQRFFSTDKISENFRHKLARRGWVVNGAMVEGEKPGHVQAAWRWAWRLVNCPYCLGAWCAFLLWPVSDHWPVVIYLLAARGLQSLFVDFGSE